MAHWFILFRCLVERLYLFPIKVLLCFWCAYVDSVAYLWTFLYHPLRFYSWQTDIFERSRKGKLFEAFDVFILVYFETFSECIVIYTWKPCIVTFTLFEVKRFESFVSMAHFLSSTSVPASLHRCPCTFWIIGWDTLYIWRSFFIWSLNERFQ